MPPKYKPGGRTFPPKGKPRSLPPQATSSVPGTSSSSSPAPTSGLSSEAEDQLELELYWCIQQLQSGLESGKLNEKQIHETNKTLNVLKSSTAPLIKKRQVMRTTFGDYRAKMVADERKLGKATSHVKFTASPASNNKSVFVRKATSAEERATSMPCLPAHEKKEDSEIHETKLKPAINDKILFRMQPSDNSFRFNFGEPAV